VAVASAEPYASLLLIPDNHANIPPLSFLQVWCPSCRPTNSVKAQTHRTHDMVDILCHETLTIHLSWYVSSHQSW